MNRLLVLLLLLFGAQPAMAAEPAAPTTEPSADLAAVAAVAKTAFIYGYPMVDGYNILYNYALDPKAAEYKAPLNAAGHIRQLAGPDDKVVVAPNVDTLYSYAWLDLRAEPVVLSIPVFEDNRYLSLQLLDTYTYIVGYVTPRTQGRQGGDYLVAGPGWTGEVPTGIRGVFRSPTALALAFYRTELLGADDLARVHALQDRYRIRPLSAYLGRAAPAPAAALRPIAPIDVRKQPTSPRFFDVLNWMLATIPTLPEEADLRRRFATIGVVPGQPFAAGDEARQAALIRGMQEGLAEMGARVKRTQSSAELFGSREFLKDDYLTRAAAALAGIFGNAAEEFLGIGYQADATGQAFDGRHRYRIRFAPRDLPPVAAFWSITAYTPERLLYANPLQRYKIGSSMLPQLHPDADGGYTLYVQHVSPGAGLEANWLPVPAGPFGLTFRTYLPGPRIRTGQWQAPPVQRLDSN
jgi:hypothetical protein